MADLPLVSLVVPCFKVERFLRGFLESIDLQGVDPELFEVILVVDGSPDNSEAVIREWAADTPYSVQINVTENRGVSSARNTGLDAATGRWITFPDPDDLLGAGYLQHVVDAIKADPVESLLATRLVRIDEGTKQALGHALDYRYSQGTRTLDLADEPTFLQLAVHTALFRAHILAEQRVRFDPRLRVFEDGKFVAQYLLAAQNTHIRVLSEAHYLYQVRVDGTGALSASDADPASRYLVTARAAHLELLQQVDQEDAAPLWLQYMVLYDLYWLFAASMRMKDPIHGADAEQLRELNALVRSVLQRCSTEALWGFNLVSVVPEIRGAWIAANAGEIAERWVRRYREDRGLGGTELRYLSVGTEHAERVISGGSSVQPLYAKWRSVRFLGEDWLYERILWVPASGLITLTSEPGDPEGFADAGTVHTDEDFRTRFGWNRPSTSKPVDARLAGGNPISMPARTPRRNPARRIRGLVQGLLNRLAVVPPFSLPYRNGWVLLDRDTQANDNAEAFAQYLVKHQPRTNTRFVVRRRSPDYRRLRKDGIRVIPFGGARHFLAVRNASHLVSSHIDEYVVRPFEQLGVAKTWNFVFLQHGVTQNDLSRWFNAKDVQLIMTATEPERRAFVSDLTPYILSNKEVRLTGFPRHDRLVAAMATTQSARTRRSVLIMPTWRSYLLTEVTGDGNSRSAGEAFADSEYVAQWSALLNSPKLAALAEAHNLELVLLPHPNLEPHLEYLSIPKSVRVESYQQGSIAGLLARAEVTVTDYSSQSFEGAFCGAPCVYFQFDREEFYGGGHIGSPGYFDVARDGFGPVVQHVDSVFTGIAEVLDGASEQARAYRQRIEEIYPARDGNASKRVFDAISALRDRR
ncbi:hypothetical protein ACI1US_00916 [Leucobacter sp. BZR 635]